MKRNLALWPWMISFKGRHETIEKVFGSKPLNSTELNTKLWNFIRKHKLPRRMKLK